jgi:hypothetical protein
MVDVNATTQSKTSEVQVFKDQEPQKNKFVKEKLKRYMVETKFRKTYRTNKTLGGTFYLSK